MQHDWKITGEMPWDRDPGVQKPRMEVLYACEGCKSRGHEMRHFHDLPTGVPEEAMDVRGDMVNADGDCEELVIRLSHSA